MTFAVLPIKRFTAAKQRLDRDDRAAVMRSMVARVLQALADSTIEHVLVVTADPEAAALARDHGAVVVDEPGLLGHSGAAALGVQAAIAAGATRVLLLPGDCPLLRGADLDALLDAHAGPGVVVLPDRHGSGTNGLLLEPPAIIDPGFGPGSRERHEQRAAAAGARCVVDERPAFAFDVDTLDDLAAIDRLRAA